MKKYKGSLIMHNDFFDNPKVIKWMLRIFYGVCVFLVALDFIIHRHISADVERIPAFYAIYGFIVCTVLVLIAGQLRKLLIREEHYYSHVVKPVKKGMNDVPMD
jgi:hypothetical protein